MSLKLVSSLLLSILSGCSNEVAAFSNAVVRPAVTAGPRQSTSLLSISNNDSDIDPRGNSKGNAPSEIKRRDALARFAAAAVTASFPAVAAAKKAPTEFSESPTSDASIARMGYDGKAAPPAKSTTASAEAAPSSTPVETKAEKKKGEDFDGNEAGAVGSTDEGTQPAAKKTKLDPKISLPTFGGEPGGSADVTNVDPILLGGAVVVGIAAIAANSDEEEKKANWKLQKPTPYGIDNPDGKNPFIKEVLEYCEGGKVTEPCAETIKEYLDDIADTGAVATSGEVKAIVGYLETLGSNSASGGKASAAFTTYMDALSSGSAPPPSSAKAVKSYLDTMAAGAPEQPEPVTASPPEAVAQGPDLSAYDSRLTNIEGRVSSLETKVDQLPDQVFQKIEAWQTRNDERLSDEVKKIVNALAQPSAPTPSPQEVVVVEAVTEPVAKVVEPAQEAPAPAPVVPASPLGGAIPDRSGMPKSGANVSVPKKYGLGGASWKTGKSPASAPAPAAKDISMAKIMKGEEVISGGGPTPSISAPAPAPSPAVAAPVVPAAALEGTIPERPGVPRAGSTTPGPKKGYGFGGAGWKTNKPRSGGGYLDNM